MRIVAFEKFQYYCAVPENISAVILFANVFMLKDEFGTTESGKRADLIQLKENPLIDVANTRKIIGVMAAGRWYDQEDLAEMLLSERPE